MVGWLDDGRLVGWMSGWLYVWMDDLWLVVWMDGCFCHHWSNCVVCLCRVSVLCVCVVCLSCVSVLCVCVCVLCLSCVSVSCVCVVCLLCVSYVSLVCLCAGGREKTWRPQRWLIIYWRWTLLKRPTCTGWRFQVIRTSRTVLCVLQPVVWNKHWADNCCVFKENRTNCSTLAADSSGFGCRKLTPAHSCSVYLPYRNQSAEGGGGGVNKYHFLFCFLSEQIKRI